jgi:hypothetical protein
MQWVSWAVFPGGKAAGREAELSSRSSAEVKNGGAKFYFPRHLHGVMLSYLSAGITFPYLRQYMCTTSFFFNMNHFNRRLVTFQSRQNRYVIRAGELLMSIRIFCWVNDA